MGSSSKPRRSARELLYEELLGKLLGYMTPRQLAEQPERHVRLFMESFERGREAFFYELWALRRFVELAHDRDTLHEIQDAARKKWPFKSPKPKKNNGGTTSDKPT